MESNIPTKRSRASAEQVSCMADFMSQNPGIATGKFQKLHGKLEHEKKWSELAAMLNSLGGAIKTVDQWHTVWRDLKSRTSIKVRDRKKDLARTGNRPTSQENITDLERRVVALIGHEYIEGNETVPENVPLVEQFQLRLEEDDETILNEMAANTRNFLDTPKTTPRRSLKRKLDEDGDERNKMLEIAKQQADTLKMLAETNAAAVEATKMMAEAIKTMGEGMKEIAAAFNNLSNSISKL